MNKIQSGLILLSMFLAITPVKGYGIPSTFMNMSGEHQKFDIFRGKPVIIEAMATWCDHCKNEHKELYKLWNSDKNTTFQMMTLSIDGIKDDLNTINAYLQDYPTPWTVGWDNEEGFKANYNIKGTPTMILFDSTGEFVNCWIGEKSFEFLSSEITSYIIGPGEYKSNNEINGQCKDPNSQGTFILIIGLSLSIIIAVYFAISAFRQRKAR